MGDNLAIQEEQEVVLTEEVEDQVAAVETADEVDDDEDLGTVVLEGEEDSLEEEPPPPARNNRVIRDLRKGNREKTKALKAAGRERTALEEQIQQLQERLDFFEQQGKAPAPAMQPAMDREPELADFSYDTEKYSAALRAYHDNRTSSLIDEKLNGVQTTQQQEAHKAEVNQAIDAHYERASQLKVPNYSKAEETVAEVLGVEMVQSIQSTIDNSEAVLYYLGSNAPQLESLRDMFNRNPARGTIELGRLSSKVTFKPTGRQAPAPDIGVPGGGGAESPQARKLIRELQQVTDAGGVDVVEKRREVFKKAEAMGITLPRL